MSNIVTTANAPAPIGPYSQAKWAGNTLYLSGQIPLNPKTGDLILNDIDAATELVMKNIGAVLTKAGLNYDNIIKSSIFLKSMDDFGAVNAVYGKYFNDNPPARECVQVARLPKDVQVEISIIAAK